MPNLVPLTPEEVAALGLPATQPAQTPAPTQLPNTYLGDVADAFQAGMQNAGASVAEGVGQVSKKLGLGPVGFGVRDHLSGMAQRNIEGMTPEAQAEMAKPMFTGDTVDTFQPNKDITWAGAGLKVAQGMGSFAPSLAAGGAAKQAVKLGLKGVTALAPGVVDKAASSLGFGATNALMTGGDAAQQARQEFLANPDAWENDPTSAAGVDAYGRGSEADLVAERVASKAFWPTAGVGFASGAVGGPMLDKMLRAKSVLGGIATGAASEFPQEGVESSGQQYFVNKAMQPFDGRDPMQGVLPAAAEGAVVGGLTGGFGGAASGAVGKGLAAMQKAPEVAPPVDPNTGEILAPADPTISNDPTQAGVPGAMPLPSAGPVAAGTPDAAVAATPLGDPAAAAPSAPPKPVNPLQDATEAATSTGQSVDLLGEKGAMNRQGQGILNAINATKPADVGPIPEKGQHRLMKWSAPDQYGIQTSQPDATGASLIKSDKYPGYVFQSRESLFAAMHQAYAPEVQSHLDPMYAQPTLSATFENTKAELDRMTDPAAVQAYIVRQKKRASKQAAKLDAMDAANALGAADGDIARGDAVYGMMLSEIDYAEKRLAALSQEAPQAPQAPLEGELMPQRSEPAPDEFMRDYALHEGYARENFKMDGGIERQRTESLISILRGAESAIDENRRILSDDTALTDEVLSSPEHLGQLFGQTIDPGELDSRYEEAKQDLIASVAERNVVLAELKRRGYNAGGGMESPTYDAVEDVPRLADQSPIAEPAETVERDPAFDESYGVVHSYVNRWSKGLGVSLPQISREAPSNKSFRAEYRVEEGAIRISDKIAADLTGRNGKLAQVAAIETLAHEFGHHIHEQYITGASKEEREAIVADFRAWKDSRDPSRPVAALLNRSTPARGIIAKQNAINTLKKSAENGGKMPDFFDPAYALSFQEWTADNVARYIMQREYNAPLSEKSKGVIARIGEKIKALYNEFAEVVKKLGQPAPSIEKFLEGYRRLTASNGQGINAKAESDNAGASPGRDSALADADTEIDNDAEILNATQTASDVDYGELDSAESFKPHRTVMWYTGGKLSAEKPNVMKRGATWQKDLNRDHPGDRAAHTLVAQVAGVPVDKVGTVGDIYETSKGDYKVERFTHPETKERVFVAFPVDGSALDAYEGRIAWELVDIGRNRVALRQTATPESLSGDADKVSPEFIEGILERMWDGKYGRNRKTQATYAYALRDGKETWIDLPTITRIGAVLQDTTPAAGGRQDKAQQIRDRFLTGMGYIQDMFGITLAPQEGGSKGELLRNEAVIYQSKKAGVIKWRDARAVSERISQAQRDLDDATYTELMNEAEELTGSTVDSEEDDTKVSKLRRDAEREYEGFGLGKEGDLTDDLFYADMRPGREATTSSRSLDTTAFSAETIGQKGMAQRGILKEGSADANINRLTRMAAIAGTDVKNAKDPLAKQAAQKRLDDAKAQLAMFHKIKDTDPDPETLVPNKGSTFRDDMEAGERETLPSNMRRKSRSQKTQEQREPELFKNLKTRVAPGTTTIDAKTVDLVNSIIRKQLGIESAVTLSDEGGMEKAIAQIEKRIPMLEAELKQGTKTVEEKWGKDKRTKEVPLTKEEKQKLTSKIDALKEARGVMKEALAGGEARFIGLYRFEDVGARQNIVFLPSKEQGAQRMVSLMHELGHHISHNVLDQVIAEVYAGEAESRNTGEENWDVMAKRQMLNELFGLDEKVALRDITPQQWADAQEKFANQLLHWATTEAAPKTALERFMKGIVAKLRSLWESFVSALGVADRSTPTEFRSFKAFMEALTARQNGIDPTTPRGRRYLKALKDTNLGASMRRTTTQQYTGIPRTVSEGYSTLQFKSDTKKLLDWAKQDGVKFLNELSKLWSTPLAEIKRMGLQMDGHDFTLDWRVMPGETAAGDTIPDLIRNHSAPYYEKMNALFAKLPKDPALYKQLSEGLVSQLPINQFPAGLQGIAGEIRGYLAELHAEYGRMGLKFDARQNYFTLVADKTKWDRERDKVVDIIKAELLRDWGQAGQPAAEAKAEEMAVLVHQHMARSDGVYFDTAGSSGVWEAIFGPSFRFQNKRVLSNAMHKALKDYYIQDIAAVMQMYTHAGFKRAAFQSVYGSTERELMIQEKGAAAVAQYEANPNNKPFSTEFDPAAKLNRMLQLARRGRNPQITLADAERFTKVLMPALMGTLGQREISPIMRAFQSWVMLGLNVALLPLSVLSSFVELGQIDVRAGRYGLREVVTGKNFAAARQIFKMLRNKGEYGKLNRLAHAIGSIRDDLLEHVLGNSMDPMYQIPLTQKINDKFFRTIGQKAWTDFTRVVGLGVAKDALREYAMDPRKHAKELKELGVTAAQIADWFSDNESTDLSRHNAVVTALNRWVDGALIRPGATMRPAWGSDPRFALFWHLKDFMWGYHEVVMRRVLSQTKDRRLLAKALPFIMLGAALMPLAMVGAELRKWLTDDLPAGLLGTSPMRRDLHGGEYWMDIMDRGGVFGPFQILLDSEEAASHGKMAVLAASGPFVSKIQDLLISQDYLDSLARMVPIAAQSPVVRHAIFGN